jgi:hypothetical protein
MPAAAKKSTEEGGKSNQCPYSLLLACAYYIKEREKRKLNFMDLQAVASEGACCLHWLLLVSDAARVPASQLGLRPDADLTLVCFLDDGVELSAWNGVEFANNQSWHHDAIFRRKRARSLKGYHVSVAIFHVRFCTVSA